MFFVSVALVFFLYTALTRDGRFPIRLPNSIVQALRRPFVAPLCALTLAMLYIAFLVLVAVAARDQSPRAPWFALMPIAIVDDRDGRYHIAAFLGNSFALLAALETLTLCALVVSLQTTGKGGRRIIFASAAAMWICSLLSPAATSGDVYAYVGYTRFFGHSYAPPHTAFGSDFRIVNAWWGVPLPPAPYGPLWFALSAAICEPFSTLPEKIGALRVFDAGALLCTLAALRSRGIPDRTLVVIALCPALLFEFLVNVHNDLAATLAILAGAGLARRDVRLAIVAATCAGLIKLPYVLVAALAFAAVSSLRVRVAAYAAVVTATLAVSWLAGGQAYLNALRAHVGGYGGTHLQALVANPLALPKLIALACIGLAFGAGTFIEGGAWLMACLGATVSPWYLVAGLPYAAYEGRALRNYVVALPLAMLATDTAIGNGSAIVGIALLTALLVLAGVARRLSALRDASQRPQWLKVIG